MKVIGENLGNGYHSSFAEGGLALVDVQWACITGNGRGRHIELGTEYLFAVISKKNGKGMDVSVAKEVLKDIATKELTDLDQYGLCFDTITNTRRNCIAIRNEFDHNSDPIPIKVTIA